MRRAVDDPSRGLDAVDARHVHVHQHDVGLEPCRPARRPRRRSPPRPTTSRSRAVASSDRRPERNDGVIVGDEDADRSPSGRGAASCRSCRRRPVERQPREDARATARPAARPASSPPSSSAPASRIDSRPVPADERGRVARAVVGRPRSRAPARRRAAPGRRGRRVAHGVGHRLDGDPVGGDLDRRRQLGQRRRRARDEIADRRVARRRPRAAAPAGRSRPRARPRRSPVAAARRPAAGRRRAPTPTSAAAPPAARRAAAGSSSSVAAAPRPASRSPRARAQPVVEVAAQPAPLLLARSTSRSRDRTRSSRSRIAPTAVPAWRPRSSSSASSSSRKPSRRRARPAPAARRSPRR